MTAIEVGVPAVLIAQAVLSLVWGPSATSRRWLSFGFSATIPLVGPLLGVLACRVRGTGQVERDLLPPAEPAPRDEDAAQEAHRIGALPGLLDRLLSDDANERLAALVTLTHRADAESITFLRWTVEHGESAAALDAFLTLDELQLGWERELEEAVAAARAERTFDRVFHAANLAAGGVLNDLADPATVAGMVAEARERYRLALWLDPSQAMTVGLRRAKLELGAGSPQVALDLLEDLSWRFERSTPAEFFDLRSRARFATRRRVSRHVGHTRFAGEAEPNRGAIS